MSCRRRVLPGRRKELLDSRGRSPGNLSRRKELVGSWDRGLGDLDGWGLAPSRFTPAGWGGRAVRSLSARSW
jgi:hypothetical protein